MEWITIIWKFDEYGWNQFQNSLQSFHQNFVNTLVNKILQDVDG